MGSLITRKKRKNKREVNVANMRTTCFGCNAGSSGCVAFDPSESFTSSSFSCKSNGTGKVVTHSTEKRLPNESGKGNGPAYVERYSPVEWDLQVDNLIFSSISHSRSMLFPDLARTISSVQTFEPTPLTQVLPQLYLGDEQDAQQAEKLIGLGITHIISVVGGGRYKDFYPKHMYIPLRDNGSSNLLAKIDDSWKFLMESQEPGNKLFVHCQLGQNRSPSFVIGYLMKSRNLSFHEAYTLLKEKRQLIHPHKNYITQLRQLDLQLHKVHSTPTNFLDIALCSKEVIKVMHHNFSKVDSEMYKLTQKLNAKEIEIDSSSLSSSISQVQTREEMKFSSVYLPDCDDT